MKNETQRLVRFQQLVQLDSFRQAVEQLLAEEQRRVVDPREDLRLALPPDEDVVERDAADDDDERHGDAETLVRNREREDEHQQEEGQEEDGDDERQPERQVEVLAALYTTTKYWHELTRKDAGNALESAGTNLLLKGFSTTKTEKLLSCNLVVTLI